MTDNGGLLQYLKHLSTVKKEKDREDKPVKLCDDVLFAASSKLFRCDVSIGFVKTGWIW